MVDTFQKLSGGSGKYFTIVNAKHEFEHSLILALKLQNKRKIGKVYET